MVFSKEMLLAAEELQEMGHEVVIPNNTEDYANGVKKAETSGESVANKIKDDLIRDYFKKIEKSDAVLIVNITKNGIENYLGGNAFLEMGFAHVLNKKVYLLNPIPEVGYKDEIVAMQPVILDGRVAELV